MGDDILPGHVVETTPLLGHERRRNALYHVLLNRKHTPGMESSRPFVKWSAYGWHNAKITMLSNKINWLLVFVPLGIVAGELHWSPVSVFTLNFFAIIPLAAILSFATEAISEHVGGALGGLLNATLGNAVELIVSVVALQAGQIEIVQASMLGSILSNLLLVMGMCFFLGGIYNMYGTGPNGRIGIEQEFAAGTAQSTCSLMALSSGSLVLPAALYNSLSAAAENHKRDGVLLLSRGTAVILLILYAMYLYFQLRTHMNLFDVGCETHAANLEAGPSPEDEEHSQAKDDVCAPEMSSWAALVVLVITTVVISVCADYLVATIDAIVSTRNISKTFIGLILIPIVGNAAEHATACVMAVRNKMDLAMGVAIGSSIQIALLVTPALVILGWIMGQPMSLRFEIFETVAFALSVIIVTAMVQDGRSNYLEGAMLMGFYAIIALAFWVVPSDSFLKPSDSLLKV